MGIAGYGHVVVPVETQAGSKSLGSIVLAFVSEVLRTLAEVGIEDALQTHLPLARQFLAVAGSNGLDIGRQHGEELVEVVQ